MASENSGGWRVPAIYELDDQSRRTGRYRVYCSEECADRSAKEPGFGFARYDIGQGELSDDSRNCGVCGEPILTKVLRRSREAFLKQFKLDLDGGTESESSIRIRINRTIVLGRREKVPAIVILNGTTGRLLLASAPQEGADALAEHLDGDAFQQLETHLIDEFKPLVELDQVVVIALRSGQRAGVDSPCQGKVETSFKVSQGIPWDAIDFAE
jgi:hypothetical protein